MISIRSLTDTILIASLTLAASWGIVAASWFLILLVDALL